LQFEFNLTKGANSGIKYFTSDALPSVGLEYQIMDDKNHPDAKKGISGNRTLASMYDLITAKKSARFVKGPGSWNHGRIVVHSNGDIEHWLNGMKLIDTNKKSSEFKDLIAKSKFKKYSDFANSEEFRILIQDHGNTVHFRSIKIKKIK
jgi:hypothetical protein